jgi:hypothetical protein
LRPPLYTVCSSANDQPAVYLSDVFETTGPLSNQPRSKAFTDFLAQKYSYKGTVACSTMSLPGAQAFVQERLYALIADNKQVFQTGWTFGGIAAAPAAAPVHSTAAPPPPGNPATYNANRDPVPCIRGRGGNSYGGTVGCIPVR